ncbi:MAG: HAD-IC family P-type ATPase [Chloroflexi bacterium]|nr:HAD-IC family P-type ATPase [Chloroflexota bacterium]
MARIADMTGQVEPSPWHAFTRSDVEAALRTSTYGLSRPEVAARLARYGPNQLEEAPPPSNLAILLHQFRSPLIYILLLATVVTVVLGEYIDAGVIAAALLLNAVIGFTQERRAEVSVRALMRLVAPHARVIREGREWEVESRELVPGDLVLLESGSRVPADMRLVATTALRVDESLLTGESLSVTKGTGRLDAGVSLADRTNMAYAGSIVASGRGRGYVVATGADTELGVIAARVRGEERAETPLQHRMTQFARVIGLVVGIAAALAFSIGIVLGQSPTHMFMVAVALAVAAVPEGLPVVFTITLALGVRRMARRNAIVRRLPAVETLGSTTTIGSDKTGTLTENRMTVQEIWAGGRTFQVVSEERPGRAGLLADDEAVELPEHRPLYLALLTGVLTNEADISLLEQGDFEVRGDPTEAALLIVAARLGIEPEEVRAAYPIYAEIPFEPERQYSASIREHDGQHFLFVKGAPERVLTMCSRMLLEEAPVALEPEGIHRAAQDLASHGLRVLGMAYRVLPHPPRGPEDVTEPEGLTFLGLQGMMDPPRAGVRGAIAGCREAGMRVVMITGDHAVTARAIGRELGLAGDDAPVLTGADLERMDDPTLRQRVGDVVIYARVAPEHKLRVVRALQRRGEVVAVTGDGVNDAPALKVADIGVAMGKSGTDVAREAADMVLADDNFVSIYAAVEEGRITFDNIRKVTFFLISTGAAAILTILTALVLQWPLPFLPAQLLWLNLVTNGLQDLALAFEPGERGVLKRPPRSREEGIISALLWERTAVAGLVMAAGTLFLFWWALDRTGSLTQAQTVALTTMVLFQNFHAGNARSEFTSVFRLSPVSNPFLFLSVAAALGVHTAALYLPPTQFVLRVEPIALEAWAMMVAVASTIVVAVEGHKLLRRGRRPALR